MSQKKKKNYLWGFLLAVIVVGLFSAAVTSFLVYQILGDEEETKAGSKENVVAEEAAETKQEWKKMASVETPAAEEPAVASPPEAEVAAPVAEVAEITPAAPPPSPPNPAVRARLQELEIRGIMGGGNKVLIFDQSTGKTKSYTPGEILDGSLALKIAAIESGSILFEDYGGATYTKSF